MLVDLRQQPNAQTLRADVCIAGAGVAGISLARALSRHGLRVCLLESGDKDFRQETQDLYAGDNVGMPYYDLVDSRLRFVGGTTNIWGGRCVPLADIDFKQRDWVPHSGWPLDPADLQPYFRRAHEQLELGAYAYTNLWPHEAANPLRGSADLTVEFWRFDNRAERFGWASTQDLRDDPRVTLVVNANVRRLCANGNASALRSLEVCTLEGVSTQVEADAYVLACGGIENPRLLLASNDVEPTGIGNRHDQVGRYFMEHPHGRAAYVESPDAFALWHSFRKRREVKSRGSKSQRASAAPPRQAGPPIAPALRLSDAAQQRERTLNSALTFKLQTPHSPAHGKRLYGSLKHALQPTRSNRALWQTYRRGRDLVHATVRPALERLRARTGDRRLALILRAEQAPNPNSRITLGPRADALGMQRAQLDWQLTPLDKHSVRSLAQRVVHALGASAEQVTYEPWLLRDDAHWPVDPSVGNHPIGGLSPHGYHAHERRCAPRCRRRALPCARLR